MSRKRADDMASIDALTQEDERAGQKASDQEIATKAVNQLPLSKEDQAKKDEEDAKRKEEEEANKRALDKVADAKDSVVSTASNTMNSMRSFLENAARPGTILLPVGILIFLYFVIVPVNGNSRLQWLWLVLTNNASLPGQPTNPNGGNNFGGGAGGTFGGGGATPGTASNTATPQVEQPPVQQPTFSGNEEIE